MHYSRHDGCFSKTPPGLTGKTSEMDEKIFVDRGPQGSAVRRGGGGSGSRTLRRSVRDIVAAVIGVSEKKHQVYTSRQEAGRRCPARKGPPWRGRGEATGDCTATESPSQTRGCGDKRQLQLGPEITERPTPESLGPFREVPALMNLGGIRSTETGSECDIEHRRSHWAARQDLVDPALRRTPMGG